MEWTAPNPLDSGAEWIVGETWSETRPHREPKVIANRTSMSRAKIISPTDFIEKLGMTSYYLTFLFKLI